VNISLGLCGETVKTLRKRNPEVFTTDEAQTATLIYTEGALMCKTHREFKGRYVYKLPMIRIRMCQKEGLEPASRVFGTKIIAVKSKQISCPPELFPPDGKGTWEVQKLGKTTLQIMNRLSPLLPTYTKQKWQRILQKCKETKVKRIKAK